MSEVRAVMMDPRDNVATLVSPVSAGQPVTVMTYDGGSVTVVARQSMPLAHKIAVQPIAKGTAVLKYGEMLGEATDQIESGAHVHVHNLFGTRGRRTAAGEGGVA